MNSLTVLQNNGEMLVGLHGASLASASQAPSLGSEGWPEASGDALEPTSPELVNIRTVMPFASVANQKWRVCSDDVFIIDHIELEPFAPPPPKITVSSVPIEIWEGVVTAIGDEHFSAVIRAKINQNIPDHVMEIERILVQPQDVDLVTLGAVFYLTMYRETTGNTVKNSEDIRFRRQPDWTPLMIQKMNQLADELPDFGLN